MITAEAVYERAREQHEDVTAYELGTTYESMQSMGRRKKTGVWYTPEPLAAAMSRFAVEIVGLRQVGPEPEQVMRVIALDPTCGCGIFLVNAARQLSIEYARRLVGAEPSGDLVLAVMPRVILNCVFGVELDPVAAELARLALSLETAGAITPGMLERHVICGDSLAGASPPAMDDRAGARSPTPVDDVSDRIMGEG